MPDLPALIFDLDGTLIDSAPDIHATANRVLATENLPPLDAAAIRSFVGSGVGVLIERILHANTLPVSGDQHRRMEAMFLKIYEEAHDLTTVYPNVIAALTRLSALGFPMAICTNKPESPARLVLRHFGLDRFFPVVIGGDTLAQRKPDPAPAHAAQAQLGARSAIFIGDSEIDAETAATARMPFALFTGGYRKAAVETLLTALIFGDFSALPGGILDLLARESR